MWVKDRLYFGTDRLFFVEQELGNRDAKPYQLLKMPQKANSKKKLKFYFDFSSPWTFLGYKQVKLFFSNLSLNFYCCKFQELNYIIHVKG